MDSNGRHRPSASASSSSTPAVPTANTSNTAPALSGSSTFRRLPSLARPFRRNPDKDKGKEVPGDRDTIVEEAEGGGGGGGHQRTSTFPSLSRVLGDSSSSAPSSSQSTPFSTPVSKTRPSEDTAISTSSSLWPPSRKSSLLTQISPANQPEAPVPNPPLSPFLRKESMRDAMVASIAPPVPVLSSQSLDDMGPITYPSHLAQRLPPEAGPGPSTSSTAASTPVSATPIFTASAARAISRTRDFTMGTPIRNSHDRERSISKDAQAVNGEELGPEPGPGGPPTGVPRRKESIQASPSVIDTPNKDRARETNGHGDSRRLERRNRLVNKNGVGDSEHDTDSGGGENTARPTRRRATTRSAADRPRDANASGKDDTPTPTSGEKDTAPRIRKSSKPHASNAASSSAPSSSSGTARPTLPCARGVSRVPASSMYFSLLPYHGRPPSQPLRAHTGTLVGDRIWVIGGVDAKHCWRGVAWYDTESLLWTSVETTGETLPPLRAHTTTAVGDKLYVFGGGDGPTYSNEVWTFDTVTHRFSKPNIATPTASLPPPRRAHTTVLYRNFLVIFGGGNGQAALNDVWALDISDPTRLTWQEWPTKGDIPQRKGYHTANLVGDKMVVFGGSDGHASFADVHVLNLRTLTWTAVNTDIKHNRLSHTSTQVGSYLFVLGGHNGQTYAQDVLLFNLVTLQWESKVPRGHPPPGRGYHVALLHDARIFISGGYNGVSVFDDLWALDLSAAAYLPQVTTFEVDETGGLETPSTVDVRA